MTPRDVDQLSGVEYVAFWEFAEEQSRQAERDAKRAERRAARRGR